MCSYLIFPILYTDWGRGSSVWYGTSLDLVAYLRTLFADRMRPFVFSNGQNIFFDINKDDMLIRKPLSIQLCLSVTRSHWSHLIYQQSTDWLLSWQFFHDIDKYKSESQGAIANINPPFNVFHLQARKLVAESADGFWRGFHFHFTPILQNRKTVLTLSLAIPLKTRHSVQFMFVPFEPSASNKNNDRLNENKKTTSVTNLCGAFRVCYHN